MRREDFIARIRRRERKPELNLRHQARMAAWLLCGYLGVGLLVLLPVFPSILLAALAIALRSPLWGGLAMALAVGYGWSLWDQFKTPTDATPLDGTTVSSAQAPRLHQLIEEIRADVRGPKIDRVIIDDCMNACIRETSGTGLTSPSQRELVIGLPLLALLPREQVAAVIGHEFGHLVGMHNRFHAYVYRMRVRFPALEGYMQRQDRWSSLLATRLLRLYLRWYLPRLAAETFVLGRACEYAADRLGATATSSAAMAQALVSIRGGALWLRRVHWPRIYRATLDHAPPTGTPYSDLLRRPIEIDADILHGLDDALCERTGYDDTHPSLADRLRALSADPAKEWPSMASGEPLDEPFLHNIALTLDESWRAAAKETWASRRAPWQRMRERMHAIRGRAALRELSAAEWLEHACLARDLDQPGWQQSLDEAYALDPAAPEIRFERARQQLAGGASNAAAELAMHEAIDDHPALSADGDRLLSRLALGRGDLQKARFHRHRADARMERQIALEAYFSQLRTADHFEAPQLSRTDQLHIQQAIKPLLAHVRCVRVTCKSLSPSLRGDPDNLHHQQLCILLFFADSWWERLTRRAGSRGRKSRNQCATLIRTRTLDLPGEVSWHGAMPDECWDGLPADIAPDVRTFAV